MDNTRFLDFFFKVGESVAIWPKHGSCHPTSTNLALGVFDLSSGSDDFFQTNTQRARMIFSRGIPLDLQREVTLLSIHDCHSFCMALSKSFLSSGLNLR